MADENKYLKPKTPLNIENSYFYPLTTADQVIKSDGSKLEQEGKIIADSSKDINAIERGTAEGTTIFNASSTNPSWTGSAFNVILVPPLDGAVRISAINGDVVYSTISNDASSVIYEDSRLGYWVGEIYKDDTAYTIAKGSYEDFPSSSSISIIIILSGVKYANVTYTFSFNHFTSATAICSERAYPHIYEYEAGQLSTDNVHTISNTLILNYSNLTEIYEIIYDTISRVLAYNFTEIYPGEEIDDTTDTVTYLDYVSISRTSRFETNVPNLEDYTLYTEDDDV